MPQSLDFPKEPELRNLPWGSVVAGFSAAVKEFVRGLRDLRLVLAKVSLGRVDESPFEAGAVERLKQLAPKRRAGPTSTRADLELALRELDTHELGDLVLDVEERLELAISFRADDFGEAEDVLSLEHDGVGSAISLEVIASGDDDSDGDGYTHEDSDGDDCNDRNAYVHPGAEEIWYDGIDQDCDDGSDFDADLDGYDRSIYGGTDCDDTDASVYPGAKDPPEDGVDQDCDGED